MRRVEHQHGCARRAVLRLPNHQVGVVEIHRDFDRARARERVLEGLADIDIEHVPELVLLAVAVGFDSGGEMRGIVRPEARFPERAQDVAEALVAEEVDPLVGEIELDALGRAVSDAATPGYGLMAGGHLRRRLKIEIPFRRELLDQAVEQLAELLLRFLVAVAAQRFEQLGRELPALDQGIENCLTQPFD